MLTSHGSHTGSQTPSTPGVPGGCYLSRGSWMWKAAVGILIPTGPSFDAPVLCHPWIFFYILQVCNLTAISSQSPGLYIKCTQVPVSLCSGSRMLLKTAPSSSLSFLRKHPSHSRFVFEGLWLELQLGKGCSLPHLLISVSLGAVASPKMRGTGFW